jgi:formylglycine-generating enzyme required for sulfatase activity
VVNYAWYFGNNGEQSQEVGRKIPNAWGLYDMSGNVFEWTYTIGFSQEGSGRLIRGGYWLSSVGDLRSAVRYYATEGDQSDNWGFRLLLVNE